MDFYYHEEYSVKIISRAFHYSFNKVGGSIQFIIGFVLLAYYFYVQRDSLELEDAIIALLILFCVFLFVFLINLIQEFRWAIPDITITPRLQLLSGGQVMVVLDIYNNEYDDLNACYAKLNKYITHYPQLPTSTNVVPDHLSEMFIWQNEKEEIEIPSLQQKTLYVAKENLDVSLEMCTNRNRIIFTEKSLDKDVNVVLVDFEVELRANLGSRKIFPKKFYGHIIFKKHLGLEVSGHKYKPATWLDLEEIRNRKDKKLIAQA